MTDRPWWAMAVQSVVGGLLLAATMGWLSRTRFEPSDRDDELVPPKSLFLIYAVSGAFFGAIAVLSVVFPGSDPAPWATVLFLGFCVMSVIGLVDYYRSRHVVEPEGLRYGRLAGRGGFASWSEVRSVRYVESMRWFRLELANGGVVRVSGMLKGLPVFATSVLTHVPPEALVGDTRTVLKAAATGELPSVWGP